MSSNEPPTTAKVILHTTKGPIEIEIWAKETPEASRNFIQNCYSNLYKGCQFDKIIPGYIIQIDDRCNSNGAKFGNEVNSRLKFNRRGLLGTCNEPKLKNSNNDQFFITLSGDCLDLQGTCTMFGKVVGDTIFNVVGISESELDSQGTVLYPAKITKCEVVVSYFDNLVEKKDKRGAEVDKKVKTKKSKVKGGIKSKAKISFGDDLDEGEVEDMETIKIKSLHDLVKSKDEKAVVNEVKSEKESGQEPIEAVESEIKPETKQEELEFKPEMKPEPEVKSPEVKSPEVKSPVKLKSEPEKTPKVIGKLKQKYLQNYKINKKTRQEDTMQMLEKFMKTKRNWM